MPEKKSLSIATKAILILLLSTLLFSCHSDLLHKIPIDNFKGTWRLQGRAMFNGIKIKITEDQSGHFVGKVVELNDNKYVDLFVSVGDIWVTGISRSSHTEFVLTEKKIAGNLFSLYGLDTTHDFKASFIDKNTIGLGTSSSDPKESSVRYIRETPSSREK